MNNHWPQVQTEELIFLKSPRKPLLTVSLNLKRMNYQYLAFIRGLLLVAEEVKTEPREVKTEKPDTPRNMKPPPEKKPRLA